MKPNRHSSLQAWIDWLLSLHAEEIDLGLTRIREVARKLGVLSPRPLVISVAGTNGKGSSVAMLSAIYQASGYQVGVYTSPHLLRFNERIQINGQLSEDQEIIDAFDAIEAARGQVKLTYFEFSTLAALLVFQRYALDVIVLEVGLGGRLDAVNVLDADASLITAIDVDHSDWLGDDRSVIALEKAGITRPEKIAVCSDNDIPDSLMQYAHQHQIDLKCLGMDFSYRASTPAWQFLAQDSVFTTLASLPYPSLHGNFQLQNAAGVVALLQALNDRLPVTVEAIAVGLQKIDHPGRIQNLMIDQQSWLIDVAHNPQSAKVLSDYLTKQNFKGNAIFSVLADKDYLPMIEWVRPYVKRWHIAPLNVPRAIEVDLLEKVLLTAGVEQQNIIKHEALSEAVTSARNERDNVLCWGSFFTVAQVFEAIKAQNLTTIEGI